MKHPDYDVIVIGGGHAGCEAAHAAARRGARTALVTFSANSIGVMSCNPAIGGLGKGHIVREIDAMDGLMGRAADQAGIQFRLLNRSKGPAVQGPRAQADRDIYRATVSRLMRREGLVVLEGEVVDLLVERGQAVGVRLASDQQVRARSVVVTTGTFLHGVIHIGQSRRPAGRWDESASSRLADRFNDLGLKLRRLKTGTPPRLVSSTIDWAGVEMQPGDDEPEMLSFLSSAPVARQISCGVTRTNRRTHEIISANIGKSALYGGGVSAAGPRYCPSIEDKVVRFADKDSHQVFLEPEGLNSDLIYPNGLSTSLPEDVQEDYIHSIRGLEAAEISRPGYAIEYAYVDPRALDDGLMVKAMPGLYLAGQINGTTGYEEAAGQGLLAGLNAAASALGKEPARFDRAEAYIGVMVDDLITRGVTEPYRMFTSRAEYRLQLRADNADQRLTARGASIGCVSEVRAAAFQRKMEQLAEVRTRLEELPLEPADLNNRGLASARDGVTRSAAELLGRFADVGAALDALPELREFDNTTLRQAHREALYAPYLERQRRDIEALRRDENVSLPEDLPYDGIAGLSNEMREKLKRVRPRTLAQAGRIEGVTPAAMTLVLLAAKAAAGGRSGQ